MVLPSRLSAPSTKVVVVVVCLRMTGTPLEAAPAPAPAAAAAAAAAALEEEEEEDMTTGSRLPIRRSTLWYCKKKIEERTMREHMGVTKVSREEGRNPPNCTHTPKFPLG